MFLKVAKCSVTFELAQNESTSFRTKKKWMNHIVVNMVVDSGMAFIQSQRKG